MFNYHSDPMVALEPAPTIAQYRRDSCGATAHNRLSQEREEVCQLFASAVAWCASAPHRFVRPAHVHGPETDNRARQDERLAGGMPTRVGVSAGLAGHIRSLAPRCTSAMVRIAVRQEDVVWDDRPPTWVLAFLSPDLGS